MDPIIEQIVASIGVDLRGIFLTVPDRKSIVPNLKPVPSESANLPMSFAKVKVLNTAVQADTSGNWSIAAILCGDDEFHLSSK